MPLAFCNECAHIYAGGSRTEEPRCPRCEQSLRPLEAGDAAAAMALGRAQQWPPGEPGERTDPAEQPGVCPMHPHAGLPGSTVCPVCVTLRRNAARRAREEARTVASQAREA